MYQSSLKTAFKTIFSQDSRDRLTLYLKGHATADLISFIVGIATPMLFDYYGHGMQGFSKPEANVSERQFLGGFSIILGIIIIQLLANIFIPKEQNITRQTMPALISAYGITTQALVISFLKNENNLNFAIGVIYGLALAFIILLVRIGYIDPSNKPELQREEMPAAILGLATLAVCPMTITLSLIYPLHSL